MSLFEFRCTRNTPYQGMSNVEERNDVTRRQGYYVYAFNANQAIIRMRKRFPNDTAGFTATLHKVLDPIDAMRRFHCHVRYIKNLLDSGILDECIPSSPAYRVELEVCALEEDCANILCELRTTS